MALTLADLIAIDSLGLRPVGSASGRPDESIQWVAVTELANPQPFLTGGEVVLTTGARQRTAPEQRSFVRQVQRAGALAIGFGVGFGHDQVPPALVAEANRWGLPVLEVPYETPFIAIGKLVADALSAEHYGKLERLLAAHQVLAGSLLKSGGLPALLSTLAEMLSADVVLTQFNSQLAGSKPGLSPAADGWTPHTVATGLRDNCTLWVRRPFEDGGIVQYATSLVSVELSNQVQRRRSERRLAGQVLQDIISGSLTGQDAAVRLSAVGINAAHRHTALIVEVPAGQLRLLGMLSVPETLAGVVTAVVDNQLVLILREEATAAAGLARALSAHLREAGLTAAVGVGGSYPQAKGLRWSYFEAKEAAARGLPVNEPERLSLTSLLLASEDVPLADLAADSLQPLQNFDAAHGAELMQTLEEYLNQNGSVAAVAEAMNLHRNTVRYRLSQIVEITGYDPAVTADRVQLWLALAVRKLG